METNFVPKKTVTIQMDLKLHRMMEELLQASGLTKSRLLEKLITDAHKKIMEDENNDEFKGEV